MERLLLRLLLRVLLDTQDSPQHCCCCCWRAALLVLRNASPEHPWAHIRSSTLLLLQATAAGGTHS
jgi:hypothetical protein